jgi:Mn2+/Fe2+ NRAMP family transporter
LSAGLNWREVAVHAVLPSVTFSKKEIILICAVLGTTISPYLFFWQTAQEVEEEILMGRDTIELRKGATDQEVRHMRLDVWSGMLLSNVVMFFIIAACAATLYTNGITDIATAADAAKALRPFAGDQAYLLFALGIIGTGLLAVPVLAGSASYAISESFGWDHGLHRQLKEASAFYGVIIISMVGGLLMNFVNIDPFKALIYSAVGNGLVAPIILVLIVLISKNKNVMGNRANRPFTTFVGWAITCIMAFAGAATIVSLFS